ncbi:hypothetical protein HanHA300_Chr13g0499891 [Helianthus annuus]|nr:hypothetical protein HanHA300_Chr13g0499891 [Helianthus annuus]
MDLPSHLLTAIKKVFCSELCGKQYKLAVEYEGHLSSYDHIYGKFVAKKAKTSMRQFLPGQGREEYEECLAILVNCIFAQGHCRTCRLNLDYRKIVFPDHASSHGAWKLHYYQWAMQIY